MTTTQKINVAALQQAFDYSTLHPEEFANKFYGAKDEDLTTYCLAGRIAEQAPGVEVLWESNNTAFYVEVIEAKYTQTIHAWAREYVGLTGPEATKLFMASPNVTLPQLWRIAQEITDGALVVPEHIRKGTR